jgi:O-antigen/teichoic acid export membrane protein
LQILLVGTVVWGVVISVGGSITGAGRPDLGVRLVAISAITNLVLNFLLIPVIGIVGAATATSASLIVATVVGLYLTVQVLRVKIDYRWYSEMALMILLAIIAFHFGNPFNEHLIGAAILCIYTLAVIIFLLNEDDWRLFLKLIENVKDMFRG